MSRTAPDTLAHDIAKSLGYDVEPSDHHELAEDEGLPNIASAGGSVKGSDVAVAMGYQAPRFEMGGVAETPLDGLESGDRVDVYKRGTGERAFMYGLVHAVNVPFGEVHLEYEGGLRSINTNDYAVLKRAAAPDGTPGYLAPNQAGPASW